MNARRTRRSRWGIGLALMFVGATAATATAGELLLLDDNPDSTGPTVVNEREQTPWFHMDTPQTNFNFNYRYDRDTSTQSGVKVATTSNDFQESVSALTQAYVISPNLLDLKLGGLLGLQQNSFDGSDQRQYTNSLLAGWDVSGTFLRNEYAPLTLYSHQTQTTVTPNFSPTLESVDTTSGANLLLRSPALPTQVEYYHTDESQVEVSTNANNFSLAQDVFHWHTDAVELPHQSLVWDYNFTGINEQESNAPPIQNQSHTANLSHTLSFGPAYANTLSSSVSLNDQFGDLGFQHYRWDENLQLQHSHNFSTHYDYSLDTSISSGVTQTINSVDAGFVHHLFNSLTTTGDVGASLLNATSTGDTPQVFGHIAEDYQKLVPYGTFLSTVSAGWIWQEQPTGTQPTPVINQPYVFNDGIPITLPQPNVIPSSVVVLSPAGIPYLEGKDYTVAQVGNLTQINRVIGGLIPPDGAVLVNYNLAPLPANTTNTGNFSIGFRYDISKGLLAGLSPYFRYGLQRQTIDSASPSSLLIPNSYDDVVVGTDYRIWLLTFNAEQEWDDSTLLPFDATRLSARFNGRFDDTTSLSLVAAGSLINYYGEHDYVRNQTISGSFEKYITRQLVTRFRAVWVDDEDTNFGDTRGLEEQLEVDWTHNQTDVHLRLRNSTLSTNAQDNTFQTVEFGFTRRF
jgi:hypothetical protein